MTLPARVGYRIRRRLPAMSRFGLVVFGIGSRRRDATMLGAGASLLVLGLLTRRWARREFLTAVGLNPGETVRIRVVRAGDPIGSATITTG